MSTVPDAWAGDFDRITRWAHDVTAEYAPHLTQHPEMREQCEVALAILRVTRAIRYFVDPPPERLIDRIESYMREKEIAA